MPENKCFKKLHDKQNLRDLCSTSNLEYVFKTIFVQRLRSKIWTYKSKFCVFSLQLVKALVLGSGSGILII